MFCSSCGSKFQEGAAFCSGCGAKAGGSIATQEAPKPATPVPQPETVMVKDFRCNGCGSPLKIPKNSREPVRCPSCKTECVIERLVQNAEMAAKENINSGISLTATPAVLHRQLVKLLCESPTIPLDVFDKVEVIREERYCVPAYCFYCNGSASFTYEVGNKRAQTYTVDRGDSVEVREKTRTEWTPGSSTASVSPTLFAPGNRKTASQLKYFYTNLDPKKLVDYEHLEFPSDVVTCNYDLPQPAAFTEYVVPLVEKMLAEKAKTSISKLNYTNFAMGGSNIQKDVVRVFLGLYHIVFKYGDKEYSVWATGDGGRAFHEGLPTDTQIEKALKEKKREKEQVLAANPEPDTSLPFSFWACLIGGFFSAGITFLVAIAIYKTHKNKSKEAKEQKAVAEAKYEKEVSELTAKASTVVQEFKAKKQALRGIYEKVSGDASAF